MQLGKADSERDGGLLRSHASHGSNRPFFAGTQSPMSRATAEHPLCGRHWGRHWGHKADTSKVPAIMAFETGKRSKIMVGLNRGVREGHAKEGQRSRSMRKNQLWKEPREGYCWLKAPRGQDTRQAEAKRAARAGWRGAMLGVAQGEVRK